MSGLNKIDLTTGNIFKNLIRFSIPYLISCFLQTFYGLADLFIAGRFNGASTISAVSIGSQVMHMITVIIVGFAMGSTVLVSRYMGAKNKEAVKKIVGDSVVLFMIIAILLTTMCICGIGGICNLLAVPKEALYETRQYLYVCFIGIIFITAYNVCCSVFRGIGDTKTPMYFVAIAGVVNIILDWILIGNFKMGAFGAAFATVISQALSVMLAMAYAYIKEPLLRLGIKDLKVELANIKELLQIGFPIAMQDGFIQIAFLVITVIANMRGVEVAAAVGIVEKLIGFMFLVPSAMLSAVSTITASCIGAGQSERGKKTLYKGILICIISGLIFTIICLFGAEEIVALFAHGEENVIVMGGQYLRSYVFDCIVAGIHFCFSGYFCAYNKSWISFVHNIISILLVRIPGAYFASIIFKDTLFPMGMAAPLGSLLSAIICIVAFVVIEKNNYKENK